MQEIKCECGNAARYIDDRGALVCGICPIKAGRDSIRIEDVRGLLAWARGFIRFDVGMRVERTHEVTRYHDAAAAALRELLGRDVSESKT